MALHSASWLFRGLGIDLCGFYPTKPRLFSLSGPTNQQSCLFATFPLADSCFRHVLPPFKSAKFSHHLVGSDWESLAQRRKIARVCALNKAYTGERAWNAAGVRLQGPSYLSRVDHCWKIRARKQRTDIGKYSFWNRSNTDWNQLPEGATGNFHGKKYNLKTRGRKVKTSDGKWRR